MNLNIYREIFKFALVYLHRNKLEKGTYVNSQIFGKFMNVSRKFLNVTQHGENYYQKTLLLISALEIMALHQSMTSQK